MDPKFSRPGSRKKWLDWTLYKYHILFCVGFFEGKWTLLLPRFYCKIDATHIRSNVKTPPTFPLCYISRHENLSTKELGKIIFSSKVSMIHLRFQMRNWNMKGKNWKPISNQNWRSYFSFNSKIELLLSQKYNISFNHIFLYLFRIHQVPKYLSK